MLYDEAVEWIDDYYNNIPEPEKVPSYSVIKRDNSVVDFDICKIINAITKAFDACDKQYTSDTIDFLALKVTADFEPKIADGKITVENIQDSVESVLIKAGYDDVAKAYILYREQHNKIRDIGNTVVNYKDVVDNYLRVNDWRVKENSTVTYSVGGLILSNSGAVTANYWLSEVYDDEIADAHRNADIHIHDLSMLTGYCAGWSLKQLIQEGLGGVRGKITSSPAGHLSTLCNQMVICQFRIVEKMDEVCFEEVDHLDSENRGGFGSTGTN